MCSQLCCLLPLPCLSFPALAVLPGSRTSLWGHGDILGQYQPRWALGEGDVQSRACPGVGTHMPRGVCPPARCAGCKETQLCREGRSMVGAARHVSIPQPTLPRDLPLSLGHRRGGVRGFTPNPMLAPALPCPPLASSQLEVSVLHLYRPRGTQPARAKLGGSNGRTGAHHPPGTRSASPTPGRASGRCRNSYGSACATCLVTVTFPGAWRDGERPLGLDLGREPVLGDLEELGTPPVLPTLR